MTKTLHHIRWVANVLLGLGCFLVLNESDSFVPNFIGLACYILLIIINRDNDERTNI